MLERNFILAIQFSIRSIVFIVLMLERKHHSCYPIFYSLATYNSCENYASTILHSPAYQKIQKQASKQTNKHTNKQINKHCRSMATICS